MGKCLCKTGGVKRNWWDCSIRRVSADACNPTGTPDRYCGSVLDAMPAVGPEVRVFWRGYARSYSAIPTFLQRYPLKCWSIKTTNIVEIHKIPPVLSRSPRLPAGYPQVQVVLRGFVDSRAETAVTDHSLFQVRQQPCAPLLSAHILSCQHAFEIQYLLPSLFAVSNVYKTLHFRLRHILHSAHWNSMTRKNELTSRDL